MKPLLTTFRTALLVALTAITLLSTPFSKYSTRSDAQACWSYLRIECFNGAVNTWPWCQPQGQGRCWATSPPPNGPLTWGLQDRYYSVRYTGSLCDQSDDQALWVIGEPGSEDPEFDNYPANLTTIATYGPLNLTNAQIAQVQFSLYFLNEFDPQDTIVWGADSVATIATAHMWVDTTISTPTDNGWTSFTVDLADLHRNIPTHDSVSALGRPVVYIYWWFKSDGDGIRGRGAFLDDVIVVTDNGTVDMIAGGLEVREPNGITTPTRIEAGDYIRSYVSWSTCNGGIAAYPDFHARMYLDGAVLYDSLMIGVQPGSTFTWVSDSFMVETDGEHMLQFQLDPLSEVVETDENNNVVSEPFTVYAPNVPPTFTWLTPGTDTLRTVNDQAILRWQLFDPDDEAICSIHIDADTFGCVGPIVPGTANRGETPGADSVIWSTITIPDNQVRWLYAEYGDALFLGCEYSPFPVLVMPLAGGERVFVPVTFSLNQNYPNPFNPETDIHFSITTAGHTTLKVFDITGREVTTLIDNDLTPGAYDTHFNAGINRPSGVYLYRLDAPEGSITKKMILMK